MTKKTVTLSHPRRQLTKAELEEGMRVSGTPKTVVKAVLEAVKIKHCKNRKIT